MTDYTKNTNFTAKDSLDDTDPDKIISGVLFDSEFDEIATAVATKADKASPTFTGTVGAAAISATGNVTVGGTLGVTGAATFSNTVGVTGAISGSSITTTGNIAVGGTLSATGAATLSSTLGVTGAITGASLTTTGAVTADSVTAGTYTMSSGEYLTTSTNDVEVYSDGSLMATFKKLSSSRPAIILNTSTSAGIAYDSGSTTIGIGFDGYNGLNFVTNSSSGHADFSVSDVRKVGGGVWGTTSDQRLKENITDYTKSLSDIKNLRPVTYTYKDTAKYGSKTYTGFIAQEVEQTGFSSMVGTDPDGYKTLDATELLFAMVNAVKDLSAKVTTLEAEVAALKAA